jgi:hypothetical protein
MTLAKRLTGTEKIWFPPMNLERVELRGGKNQNIGNAQITKCGHGVKRKRNFTEKIVWNIKSQQCSVHRLKKPSGKSRQRIFLQKSAQSKLGYFSSPRKSTTHTRLPVIQLFAKNPMEWWPTRCCLAVVIGEAKDLRSNKDPRSVTHCWPSPKFQRCDSWRKDPRELERDCCWKGKLAAELHCWQKASNPTRKSGSTTTDCKTQTKLNASPRKNIISEKLTLSTSSGAWWTSQLGLTIAHWSAGHFGNTVSRDTRQCKKKPPTML